MKLRRIGTTLAFLSIAAWMMACSGFEQARQRQIDSNELKQIGLAWHNYCDTNRKGPSRPEDLFQYMGGSNAPPSQALKSGKYVFLWGVSVSDIASARDGPGTGRTVLAYAATVPASGGLVLMADASVEQMTAAQFNAATKADRFKKK
jgi:hypothetical protein